MVRRQLLRLQLSSNVFMDFSAPQSCAPCVSMIFAGCICLCRVTCVLRAACCLSYAGCRYESAEPHQHPLPGQWQEQLGGHFAVLLLVKQLREEKLVFAAQHYVAAKLGREFTDPELWTLDGVFQETSARTPIIFILSTGLCSCWR